MHELFVIASAPGITLMVMHASHHACCNPHVQVRSSLSAEDRFAIMELCHRFDHAINRTDQDATGTLFASSAILHTPKGDVNGPDAIVDFFKSVAPMAKGNRHLTLDIVITGEGMGKATAKSYRLLVKASAPTMLVASGTIEDHVVKENDGMWRFASRKFIMDAPAEPAPAP